MSRIITIVLAGALGTVSLSPPVAAAALAGETCQGRSATIVGAPGQEIAGTDGADVIVTNGAVEVQAGAGDDVVCTTNSVPRDENSYAWDVYVEAGAGADVVDRTGDLDPVARGFARLGEGDDTFLGAVGGDRVYADAPGHDTIHTGSGDDLINVEDTAEPHHELDGGDGHDLLTVEAGATGLWTLDMSTAAPPTGARTVTGTGMEHISFSALYRQEAKTQLRFTGSDAGETLGFAPSSMVRAVDMGAGDDRLQLSGIYYENPDAHAPEPLDGGTGTDTIQVQALDREVRLDLAQDRLDYRLDNAGPPENSIPGFENASVIAGPVRVLGDDGPNVIEWNGCPGIARGRGGDDVLDWQTSPVGNPCRNGGTTSMWGNSGDDTLIGGNRQDDRLIGGAGLDSARGGGGRDICRAESTTGCERTALT